MNLDLLNQHINNLLIEGIIIKKPHIGEGLLLTIFNTPNDEEDTSYFYSLSFEGAIKWHFHVDSFGLRGKTGDGEELIELLDEKVKDSIDITNMNVTNTYIGPSEIGEEEIFVIQINFQNKENITNTGFLYILFDKEYIIEEGISSKIVLNRSDTIDLQEIESIYEIQGSSYDDHLFVCINNYDEDKPKPLGFF